MYKHAKSSPISASLLFMFGCHGSYRTCFSCLTRDQAEDKLPKVSWPKMAPAKHAVLVAAMEALQWSLKHKKQSQKQQAKMQSLFRWHRASQRMFQPWRPWTYCTSPIRNQNEKSCNSILSSWRHHRIDFPLSPYIAQTSKSSVLLSIDEINCMMTRTLRQD